MMKPDTRTIVRLSSFDRLLVGALTAALLATAAALWLRPDGARAGRYQDVNIVAVGHIPIGDGAVPVNVRK